MIILQAQRQLSKKNLYDIHDTLYQQMKSGVVLIPNDLKVLYISDEEAERAMQPDGVKVIAQKEPAGFKIEEGANE